MYNRRIKRAKITSAILTLALIAVIVTAPGMTAYGESDESAADNCLSSILDDSGVGKDETVYVIADANGSPQKIIVSDWLKNEGGSQTILDKSTLKDIKNTKGEETYSIDRDNMVLWQAKGKDIHYRGTTSEALPVDLKVGYELDGKPISAEDLAGKSGRLTITFSYTNNEKEQVRIDGKTYDMYVPFLMVTGVVLDNDKAENITVTNGRVINDGDRSVALGLALPGMQEDLGIARDKADIPDTVKITADVTDFELETTITFASNEFFNTFDFKDASSIDDIESRLDKFAASADRLVSGSSDIYGGLTTLYDGSGEFAAGAWDLTSGVLSLKTGAEKAEAGAERLSAGAEKLAAGCEELAAGAEELKAGLDRISANSASVNEGAKQVFQSLIDNANSQLQAAGLDITLTIENYHDTLQAAIAGLSQADIRAVAEEKARAQVEAQVRQNQAQIAAGVTAAVRSQVLDGVLSAMGLTKDTYSAGIAAGQITSEQQAVVDAEVERQMSAMADTINSETEAQIYALIEQNMASPAVANSVEEAVAAAGTASGMLGSLQASLDSYNTFYKGILDYTAGVDKAASGAGDVASGADKTASGARDLAAAASALKSGQAELTNGSGELYDGMQTLQSGAASLVAGVKQLRDGSATLYDGMKEFNEAGVKKITALFKGEVGDLLTRLKAMSDISRDYTNYGGIAEHTDGSVKFIYKTDEIKLKD